MEKLDRSFFERDAEEVARGLLGCFIVRKIDGGVFRTKIVETEAYFDENDPASRARQNGDLRKTMLMEPGTFLVYGVLNSWLLNIVTGFEGRAEAVLIRALEPVNFEGDLSGPGKLTKGLKIDKSFHKENIENSELWLEKEDNRFDIVSSKRIGIKEDLDRDLRFFIKGSRFISK